MSRLRPLPIRFYRRPADEVAPDLLGRYLVRELDGECLVLRIVETEAYLGAKDRASHAWGGRRTARTETLYRKGGVAYVYLIYGMYDMLNVVADGSEIGEAVLVRAGEPVAGAERMRSLRALGREPRSGDLAGGPGKLCRALAVDRELDGAPLHRGELRITRGAGLDGLEIVTGPRIGIDYAGDHAAWPLRYAVAGNEHVSRPRPDGW